MNPDPTPTNGAAPAEENRDAYPLGKVRPRRPDTPEEAELLDAVLADFKAGYGLLESGQLDQCEDQYIAMVNGKVAATGNDQGELRARVCIEQGIPLNRIAIIHIGI